MARSPDECTVCGCVHVPPYACEVCGHVTADRKGMIHWRTFSGVPRPDKWVCLDADACYRRFKERRAGKPGRHAAGAGP